MTKNSNKTQQNDRERKKRYTMQPLPLLTLRSLPLPYSQPPQVPSSQPLWLPYWLLLASPPALQLPYSQPPRLLSSQASTTSRSLSHHAEHAFCDTTKPMLSTTLFLQEFWTIDSSQAVDSTTSRSLSYQAEHAFCDILKSLLGPLTDVPSIDQDDSIHSVDLATPGSLLYYAKHLFCDLTMVLVSSTLFTQEFWTEDCTQPKAFRRAAKRGNSQKEHTEYFHRLPHAAAD